jgi:hypothetical protein
VDYAEILELSDFTFVSRVDVLKGSAGKVLYALTHSSEKTIQKLFKK